MKTSIFFSSLIGQLFRHERIVLGTVAALLIVGGYAAILNPIVRDIREVGILDYNRESRQLTDRRSYQARLEASLAKYRALPADMTTSLSNSMPTQEDLPGLFVFLDDLVTYSGMTLTTVAATPGTAVITPTTAGETVSSSLRSLNVQVAASPSSGYQSVKTLLDNLEKSQRLFDVISINFTETSASKTDQTAGGGVTLSLRTYYLAQTP